jgi:hypothetical protein
MTEERLWQLASQTAVMLLQQPRIVTEQEVIERALSLQPKLAYIALRCAASSDAYELGKNVTRVRKEKEHGRKAFSEKQYAEALYAYQLVGKTNNDTWFWDK